MECKKQMGASQLLLHPPGNAVRQMVHIGITDRPKPGSRAEPGFWHLMNVLRAYLAAAANPFSKSARISSICSVPMDRRMVLGLMP